MWKLPDLLQEFWLKEEHLIGLDNWVWILSQKMCHICRTEIFHSILWNCKVHCWNRIGLWKQCFFYSTMFYLRHRRFWLRSIVILIFHWNRTMCKNMYYEMRMAKLLHVYRRNVDFLENCLKYHSYVEWVLFLATVPSYNFWLSHHIYQSPVIYSVIFSLIKIFKSTFLRLQNHLWKQKV